MTAPKVAAATRALAKTEIPSMPPRPYVVGLRKRIPRGLVHDALHPPAAVAIYGFLQTSAVIVQVHFVLLQCLNMGCNLDGLIGFRVTRRRSPSRSGFTSTGDRTWIRPIHVLWR